MFSLCYLPTAGRLTITMIKARNLKAMDITGASDPYVKVSLMCDGRRLKKRKTSTKRNTLNPVYNEAIVFDVPPENIDQISLLVAVMDYDRCTSNNHRLELLKNGDLNRMTLKRGSLTLFIFSVGHNEVIGVCRVGNDAEGLGREHWNEMLTYPRKPIAHWHPLIEGGNAEQWPPCWEAVRPDLVAVGVLEHIPHTVNPNWNRPVAEEEALCP
ncbi:Synaptotagmin-9 [Anabarilius grahami]|uniref:Synaptotagmin-9 n=1 Tax=Anabarilius grahami TaxID=495550 RepID=A0A3N0XRE3_ANAGA|nr:Synaptotagmin-9 [Anabarilius grahami]